MSPARKRMLLIVLPFVFTLLVSPVWSQESRPTGNGSNANGASTDGPGQEEPAAMPRLTDIVPAAKELSRDLATLKKNLEAGPDVSELQRKYDGIESRLEELSKRLAELRSAEDSVFGKIPELKSMLDREQTALDALERPLNREIERLGAFRKEWRSKKKGWEDWKTALVNDGTYGLIETPVDRANQTIADALSLILSRMQSLLELQSRQENLEFKAQELEAELDRLVEASRRGTQLQESPPMFSSAFVSQFRGELWLELGKGIDSVSWQFTRFWNRFGWVLLVQALLSIITVFAVYQRRDAIAASEHGSFMAKRPVSSGLFVGGIVAAAVFEYAGGPGVWTLVLEIITSVALVRLLVLMSHEPWVRSFFYWLITVFIMTGILHVISLPLPLFRVYIVVTSIVSCFLFIRWASQSRTGTYRFFTIWALRLGGILFFCITAVELWGYAAIAEYLFTASLRTAALIIILALFAYMIRWALESALTSTLLNRFALIRRHRNAITRRLNLLADVVFAIAFVTIILVTWRVYDNLGSSFEGLTSFGIEWGSREITVGLVFVAAAFLYGSYILSWVVLNLIADESVGQLRAELGVRYSIGKLVSYTVLFLGLLVALSILGLDLTNVTIVLGALGVGIGFGLQGIVNNFLCGLILLVERPVRVGDYIELQGTWSVIKKIGLRATTVETFDSADVIVPNADLISTPVTNWTLGNRLVRIIIPVGVAYGSDVTLVTDKLRACGEANPLVTSNPAPQVLFRAFGESSLNFELRVWVRDADEMLIAQSEILFAIDEAFRDAGIVIAFPQRDLHLRSADESLVVRTATTAG